MPKILQFSVLHDTSGIILLYAYFCKNRDFLDKQKKHVFEIDFFVTM